MQFQQRGYCAARRGNVLKLNLQKVEGAELWRMDMLQNWEILLQKVTEYICVFKANLLHLEIICCIVALSDPRNLACSLTGTVRQPGSMLCPSSPLTRVTLSNSVPKWAPSSSVNLFLTPSTAFPQEKQQVPRWGPVAQCPLLPTGKKKKRKKKLVCFTFP